MDSIRKIGRASFGGLRDDKDPRQVVREGSGEMMQQALEPHWCYHVGCLRNPSANAS
jgi:hypothetical protein